MELNEWYYAELLKLLKEKEIAKEERLYQPIELELPYIEPQIIGDERKRDEDLKDRGVVVINLNP